jgi:hypothetical protein
MIVSGTPPVEPTPTGGGAGASGVEIDVLDPSGNAPVEPLSLEDGDGAAAAEELGVTITSGNPPVEPTPGGGGGESDGWSVVGVSFTDDGEGGSGEEESCDEGSGETVSDSGV